MNHGKCRLCGNVGELRRSHIFSSGAVRGLRNPDFENPNPGLLSKGKLISTSRQATWPLLCAECEARFNDNGERWVLAQQYRRGGVFPLLELLRRAPSKIGLNGTICVTGFVPEIKINQLVYFAASIFWRASVFRVPFEKDVPPVVLGARYEEQFRLYLLGQTEFPTDAVLMISVSPSPAESAAVWLPSGGKQEGKFWVWRFSIPGVLFDLLVGKGILDQYRKACVLRSPGNLILVTKRVDAVLLEGIDLLAASRQ